MIFFSCKYVFRGHHKYVCFDFLEISIVGFKALFTLGAGVHYVTFPAIYL